jgi:hypothetical protein
MHFLKSFYFFSIGSLLWFFFLDNIHDFFFFHFYLYSVREENTFYFEIFEKSFFVFCLLQFYCITPNAHRSLLSLVVCSSVKLKYMLQEQNLGQNIWDKVRCYSMVGVYDVFNGVFYSLQIRFSQNRLQNALVLIF